MLRKDRFDEKEEDFYEALYTQSQAQFNSYVETSTVLNNYAHVFSLLVRLRQAVNHPYLVVHSSSGGADGAVAAGGQQGSCTICRDPLEVCSRFLDLPQEFHSIKGSSRKALSGDRRLCQIYLQALSNISACWSLELMSAFRLVD